jgi:hypothetical protein
MPDGANKGSFAVGISEPGQPELRPPATTGRTAKRATVTRDRTSIRKTAILSPNQF